MCKDQCVNNLFDNTIWLIWNKARVVEGMDPNVTRMDDLRQPD